MRAYEKALSIRAKRVADNRLSSLFSGGGGSDGPNGGNSVRAVLA